MQTHLNPCGLLNQPQKIHFAVEKHENTVKYGKNTVKYWRIQYVLYVYRVYMLYYLRYTMYTRWRGGRDAETEIPDVHHIRNGLSYLV